MASEAFVEASVSSESLLHSTTNDTSHLHCTEPSLEQPDGDSIEADTSAPHKKKKKKKPKKSAAAKAKEAAAKKATAAADADRPPVLCISRNKHWRYISSYHGPWLQLPLELLESLFALNLDPATLSVPEPVPVPHSFGTPRLPSTGSTPQFPKIRDTSFESLISDPDSPGGPGGRFTSHEHHMLTTTTPLPPPIPLPLPKPGKAPPPPIDPGVFRNVTSIRKLIDEAAELSVRAASGLSAAELASPSMYGGMNGYNGNSWAAAQALGINPLGGNGGRNVAMSAMRIHRLRALAVQKLAQAYKADEIASSVMVMQGGSVFDDVAEKVLKVDPNDVDAKYVHFFHEKIPSRQLAESTTTQILDDLIAANPQRLEYFRTRGVVHCFRDEYSQAIKDFTHALKEARAARKYKMMNRDHSSGGGKIGKRDKAGKGSGTGKKKKGRNAGNSGGRTNGQAPPNGTSAALEDVDSDGGGGDGGMGDTGECPTPLHPSALPDAPDPMEPQLLFLRGSAYLSQAVHLIELAVLDLEGLDATAKPKDGSSPSSTSQQTTLPSSAYDTSEIRLCYLPDSLYGGVEIGNPAGPLGPSDAPKLKAYREVLAAPDFRDHITSLIKKGIRDHERFLSHFDTLEADLSHEKGKGGAGSPSLKGQTEYAFALSESTRPGNYASSPGPGSPPPFPDSRFPPPSAAMFTTYHPLLVESHYTILLASLMLGNFSGAVPKFIRTASLVDGLEGYPVFLPPRSMAQAEFVEVLERLAGGWRKGAFEDEFALVPASGRNSASSSSSPLTSGAPSTYSGAGSSGTSSPATTTTDLYDDVFVSNTQPEFPADIGIAEAASSSLSGFGYSSSSSRPFIPVDHAPSPSPTFRFSERPDASEALDNLRILLAPVIARQRERADAAAAERNREKEKANLRAVAIGAGTGKGKNASAEKKPVPINIPLHGPRVEVVLAWLGAVHLPELDG
ncbi:hypothetical protein BDP27DRAFT_1421134 [Rhodocollybia butyracea]|uniref:Uncharacterized protein n=1 Tax=Rhodocollybia butyracea TaxID=206335 RepID=A0A9P5PNW9_9AGAR|nr:hypothetical protein BDP27DRAFT_1421134 [Rhodocollybia butyracea]